MKQYIRLTLLTLTFYHFTLQGYYASNSDEVVEMQNTSSNIAVTAAAQISNIFIDTFADTFLDLDTIKKFFAKIIQKTKSKIDIVGTFKECIIYNLIYQSLVFGHLVNAENDSFFYETLYNVTKFKITPSNNHQQKELLPILTKINTVIDKINRVRKSCKSSFSNLIIMITAIQKIITLEQQKTNISIEEQLDIAYSCINTIDFKEYTKIKKGTKYDFSNEKEILLDLIKLSIVNNITSQKIIDLQTTERVLNYNPQKILIQYRQTINETLHNTRTKISNFFGKMKEIFKEQSFNYFVIAFNSLCDLIKQTNTHETSHSISEIGERFTADGVVHSALRTTISFSTAFIPVVGTLLSTLTWAVDDLLVQNVIQSTSAIQKFLQLFNNIDFDVKITLEYLFEGLFKELQNLNKFNMRFITSTKGYDDKPLLGHIIQDLSSLFTEIYKNENLKSLSPLEMANFITTIKLSQGNSVPNAPILETLIRSNIKEKKLKNLQKYYTYYSSFINIYCGMMQLLETMPLINDFYTFAKEHKDLYDQSDSDYDKVLKMIFYYIEDKYAPELFSKVSNQISVAELINEFNKHAKNNPEVAVIMERLITILSMCVCYNEKNNGLAVSIGRYLHINREKHMLKAGSAKDAFAKIVNWGTKKLTGSKLKIFTNDMLKAILSNNGIHIYNPYYQAALTPERLKDLSNIIQNWISSKQKN